MSSEIKDTESALNSEQRVELCRCGHTRGNHRWFAVSGKRPCYHHTDNVQQCPCATFVPKTTEATDRDHLYERQGSRWLNALPGTALPSRKVAIMVCLRCLDRKEVDAGSLP